MQLGSTWKFFQDLQAVTLLIKSIRYRLIEWLVDRWNSCYGLAWRERLVIIRYSNLEIILNPFYHCSIVLVQTCEIFVAFIFFFIVLNN